MDVMLIAEEISLLKVNLVNALRTQLEIFKQKTGIHPSAITVKVIEVTAYPGHRREFEVGSVELDFKF